MNNRNYVFSAFEKIVSPNFDKGFYRTCSKRALENRARDQAALLQDLHNILNEKKNEH